MISFPQQSQLQPIGGHDFSRTPTAQIQRSSFDRSHGLLTTFDEGYLIPVYWDFAYPGDTHSLNASFLCRLATPLKPQFTRMVLESFYFVVPLRLVHTDAPKMLGEVESPQVDPYDPPPANTHVVPQIIANGVNNASGTLADYFGIPCEDGAGDPIIGLRYSAYFFRAYYRVWNDWFRDQNQQALLVFPLDEADDATGYTLQRINKKHDYFTSVLPWPQKSAPVTIPMAGNAPLVGTAYAGSYVEYNAGAGWNAGGDLQDTDPGAGQQLSISNPPATPYVAALRLGIDLSGVTANMAGLTALTLTQFFQSYAIQQLYQADARHGTRYTELIVGHFGVHSPDMRLQRSEIIGHGKTDINVLPIPQTSATAAGGTVQGNLAAMGVGLGSSHGFTYSATEHCLIIGLVAVRADLTYQQGLERELSARTRFDFYWPALANIGEQAVETREIYCDANQLTDSVVFGYQEAWAHLRYKRSSITGLFRSNIVGSLDLWHLSQDFGNAPTLGSTFIEENAPIDRVIAVPSEPHFILDAYFRLNSVRPMPVYSIPGIQNRF